MRILMPLPSYGFDPTEAAVPWTYFVKAGFDVVFATPQGAPANADTRMLAGEGLGLFSSMLKAAADTNIAYEGLTKTLAFCAPCSYDDIRTGDFDALYLTGGHDPGMREYLESTILQNVVGQFFHAQKPVAAICHGTVLLARSKDPASGRSVLWGRKTTGLLRKQEMLAYWLTRHRLGNYYRTYPETTVQDEVTSVLRSPADFIAGHGCPLPWRRDTATSPEIGFVHRDGNYFSARWPGDAHRLGREFSEMVLFFNCR